MRRSRSSIFISILLMAAMAAASLTSVFGSVEEKNQEARDAGQAAEEASKAAEEATAQSEAAEQEAAEAEEQAEALEARIEEMVAVITEKQAEIDALTAKIEETREKLEKKQKEIDAQQKLLDDRLETMYKTGTVGFVDVLLSSDSIDELMTNLTMVQVIVNSDKELIRQLREDYEQLDLLKTQLEAQELELESQKAELEATKASYQAEADAYRAIQEQKEAEANELAAQAAAKQAEADAKLAEKRKALAEAAREAGGDAVIVNSGTYAWPVDGPLTSMYGWRIHPILGVRMYHSGYDIGASTGTPVVAAGDGVVTMASWYGTYGNCIQIYIGDGYTTLYGHLSGFAVSEGDYVLKGQVVGYVGSTGRSTGPHLHYSVLKDGDYVDPYILY